MIYGPMARTDQPACSPEARMPGHPLFTVPASFETPRLTIRAFCPDDAPALHEALVESIDQLREFLWFLPWIAEAQTLQSAQVRCRNAHENFLQCTDLPYLVFDRNSNRLLGSVGLHRTDWTLPRTEVGYWIRSSEAGKGHATEAVNVLADWAIRKLGVQRVDLITDELNAGSRSVALRCGFTLEGILHNTMRSPDGRLRNTCVYARLPT